MRCVVPQVFQHLYATVSDHYPDLLVAAKIVPASWFFSACYKITSRVMDASSGASSSWSRCVSSVLCVS